tara:strand:- start:80 stop:682 length:603 start_codon:yes stop_codon:yes gene_type:complete
MNRLNNKANENMKLLLTLQPEDNIVSSNGMMSLQDEYVQVDNTTDIEYGIYFTLNQLLFLNTYENIYENDILKKIDDAIDTIYHNKQLNQLIENEERFKDVIDDIDEKLDMMKERMYYGSPFFNGFKRVFCLMNNMKQIFLENQEYVGKMLYVTKLYDLKGDYLSSDDSDNDSDDSDNDDNDEDDNDDGYEGDDNKGKNE